MAIEYRRTDELDARTFVRILNASGLGARRLVEDLDRIERMLRNANLVIVAIDTETGEYIGLARSLTDFSYCCYLADLAVDGAYQGRGIGKRLIAETRAAAGPESMCLLLSAPGARSFYERIGMPHVNDAFLYRRER